MVRGREGLPGQVGGAGQEPHRLEVRETRERGRRGLRLLDGHQADGLLRPVVEAENSLRHRLRVPRVARAGHLSVRVGSGGILHRLVDGDERVDVTVPGRPLRLRAGVHVGLQRSIAPTHQRQLLRPLAGGGPDGAGEAQSEPQIAELRRERPVLHEGQVRGLLGNEHPTVIDAPHVEILCREVAGQRGPRRRILSCRSASKRRGEAPTRPVDQEDGASGLRRDSFFPLTHQPVDGDRVVLAGSHLQEERVGDEAVGQRPARHLLEPAAHPRRVLCTRIAKRGLHRLGGRASLLPDVLGGRTAQGHPQDQGASAQARRFATFHACAASFG